MDIHIDIYVDDYLSKVHVEVIDWDFIGVNDFESIVSKDYYFLVNNYIYHNLIVLIIIILISVNERVQLYDLFIVNYIDDHFGNNIIVF